MNFCEKLIILDQQRTARQLRNLLDKFGLILTEINKDMNTIRITRSQYTNLLDIYFTLHSKISELDNTKTSEMFD